MDLIEPTAVHQPVFARLIRPTSKMSSSQNSSCTFAKHSDLKKSQSSCQFFAGSEPHASPRDGGRAGKLASSPPRFVKNFTHFQSSPNNGTALHAERSKRKQNSWNAAVACWFLVWRSPTNVFSSEHTQMFHSFLLLLLSNMLQVSLWGFTGTIY